MTTERVVTLVVVGLLCVGGVWWAWPNTPVGDRREREMTHRQNDRSSNASATATSVASPARSPSPSREERAAAATGNERSAAGDPTNTPTERNPSEVVDVVGDPPENGANNREPDESAIQRDHTVERAQQLSVVGIALQRARQELAAAETEGDAQDVARMQELVRRLRVRQDALDQAASDGR